MLHARGGEESVGVLGARLLQEVPDVGAFGLAGVCGKSKCTVCGVGSPNVVQTEGTEAWVGQEPLGLSMDASHGCCERHGCRGCASPM